MPSKGPARARRPIFLPLNYPPRVRAVEVEFDWYPGFAVQQQQKSVSSLHEAVKHKGLAARPLEVSTRSTEEVGRRLSAFNMRVMLPEVGATPLESAFQSAKVFADGGPYRDLARLDARSAKKDPRLRTGAELTHFDYLGEIYPRTPVTAFYDWLYIRSMEAVEESILEQLLERDGFTDIAFNPQKSLNCQARSVALFTSFRRSGDQAPWRHSFEAFLTQVGY